MNVQVEGTGTSIAAHSNVLASHSSIFAGLIAAGSNRTIIVGYEAQVVRVALQFCYTGEVDFVHL